MSLKIWLLQEANDRRQTGSNSGHADRCPDDKSWQSVRLSFVKLRVLCEGECEAQYRQVETVKTGAGTGA
jgi:hypothetical protein